MNIGKVGTSGTTFRIIIIIYAFIVLLVDNCIVAFLYPSYCKLLMELPTILILFIIP